MKSFLYILFSSTFLFQVSLKANESFSVEIEALTLVMEKYNEEFDKDNVLNIQKPNYMAFKLDECNATVEVTEKNGFQITNTESFDVNVCKKEINRVKTN